MNELCKAKYGLVRQRSRADAGHFRQKEKHRVWLCRECSAPREFDSIFRKAAQTLFNEKQVDGLFAQYIEKAINYEIFSPIFFI